MGGFRTTSWTLVDQACGDDPALGRAAHEQLARRYMPAIEAFLLRTGHRAEAAAELTQGFYAEVVIGRNLFSKAQRERGRLRSLILTALANYERDQARRAEVRSRAGSAVVADASADLAEAQRSFERVWAREVVSEAVRECERHFSPARMRRHWDAFEARVLVPAIHHTSPPAFAALAERCGFRTSADAVAAVQYVRKRFDVILSQKIAECPGEQCTRPELLAMLNAAG
ncbi:MAG: hypothetical protein GIKADHBN_02707 [Phycisphaerales bacterium]|nr:hypothetical protein [Phycisphaerales bacterium]